VSEQAPPDAGLPRADARLRVIGVALSAISLGGVIWWARSQPAPKLPSGGAQLASLGAAIAAYALATIARGERWHSLLGRIGGTPSRADSYSLTAVGYMGNNVLPARGGDAMRVVLMAPRSGTTNRGVIGTLVAERLLDVVVLLALFVVLAYGVLRGVDAPSAGRLGLALAGLATIGMTAAIVLTLGRRRGRVARLLGFVRPMLDSTRGLRGRYGTEMVGVTAVIWGLEAATYLAVAGAIGLGINPIEAAYIVAIASVFVLVPSGPGYIGTLDAAVLFGARAVGASGSQSVSYLLTLRFVLLIPITVAGLVLLLTRYGRRTPVPRELS
jgi:uncharacterized membrane protein YbhN (UPF0104 family)